MRDLVTSDLHLSANPRDEYRFSFLARLRKLIVREGVQRLFILGDLTEAKDNHDAPLVNRIVEEIVRLARLAEVFFLRGNHDGLDPGNPFFEFVRRLSGVHWISQPQVLEGDLWLPHMPSYGEAVQELLAQDNYRFAFAHNTFKGAVMEGGRVAEEGIPLAVIPVGVRVYSGDVHVPQKLGPVTYVGAPYTIDFGDNYNPRVLLLEKDSVRSIALKGPQKHLLDIRSITELDDVPELAAGTVLKVRVRLKAGEYAQWHETKKAIADWALDRGFLLHATQPIMPQTDRVIPKQEVRATSDRAILKGFAQRRGLDRKTTTAGEELL
jgi:hypothetical protein